MASLEELREIRLKKLKLLKERGINPYPIESGREHSLKEAAENFEQLEKKPSVTVAGRIMQMRSQGALAFCDLSDGTGRFQGLIKKDEVGDQAFALFLDAIDSGDFVELTGSLFVTKRGEKTLLAKTWRILSKSLRPLPDKWEGLTDVEERFRRRYLDLISSEESKKRFLIRSKIVREVRNFLERADFIEVETSMLQAMPGGANAEPFRTHHNALDIDMYLRIAQEIDLKKMLVGGFPKIYELGRNFRNEGIDVTHNPEFTTVEWYEAFSNAKRQRAFVEALFRHLTESVTGGKEFKYDGQKINVEGKFDVIKYYDLLKKYALITDPEKAAVNDLELSASQFGAKIGSGFGREKILDAIYKKVCRPKLIQPTFIVDYPSNAIPLAKKKEDSADTVDAFQLVIGGVEIVKAFSELNDPIDQRERFSIQEKDKEAGDKEAQSADEAFLEALEYGMPPAGGVGFSIDRTAMLLTDQKNIREVILFPTLRPRASEK